MATSLRTTGITVVTAVAIALASISALSTAAPQQASGQPPSAPTSPSDEARMRAIIAEQVVAWNRGDARAFSSSFAEDGSFTNIRGTVFYGQRAFEERHVEIFRTFFKGSKLAMSPSKVRFVRPDVAIVDVETELSELKDSPPGIRPGCDGHIRTRLQEVFVRTAGEWRIESYHNVDVKSL